MADGHSVLHLNGRLVPEADARISPMDRGFTLADGVFETMVARGDRVFRLADHLGRLADGARLLFIHLPGAADLEAAVRETLRANGLPASVARLTVTRGLDQGRGLSVAGGDSPTVVVRVSPHGGFGRPLGRGLRLVVSRVTRNEGSPTSRAKTLSYTDGVLARREAQMSGADDALLLNGRATLACATSSNLFTVAGGRLTTPPEDDGALPGVARRTVLELARAAGVPCSEASVTAGLEEVDEAFLTNVVTGIVPIAWVAGQTVGATCPGPVTERLAEAYRVFFERETAG